MDPFAIVEVGSGVLPEVGPVGSVGADAHVRAVVGEGFDAQPAIERERRTDRVSAVQRGGGQMEFGHVVRVVAAGVVAVDPRAGEGAARVAGRAGRQAPGPLALRGPAGVSVHVGSEHDGERPGLGGIRNPGRSARRPTDEAGGVGGREVELPGLPAGGRGQRHAVEVFAQVRQGVLRVCSAAADAGMQRRRFRV